MAKFHLFQGVSDCNHHVVCCFMECEGDKPHLAVFPNDEAGQLQARVLIREMLREAKSEGMSITGGGHG